MSYTNGNGHKPEPKNVLGGILKTCSTEPLTGFFRDGCCKTGLQDVGTHTVCTRVSDEFLKFSYVMGNDLITPHPEFQFPGLKAGDQWCLCASRWREALEAGVAPPVDLEATHEKTLEFVSLEDLKKYAIESV